MRPARRPGPALAALALLLLSGCSQGLPEQGQPATPPEAGGGEPAPPVRESAAVQESGTMPLHTGCAGPLCVSGSGGSIPVFGNGSGARVVAFDLTLGWALGLPSGEAAGTPLAVHAELGCQHPPGKACDKVQASADGPLPLRLAGDATAVPGAGLVLRFRQAQLPPGSGTAEPVDLRGTLVVERPA